MSELFKEFQEFRKILCVCPCCGEIVRVSDLHIRAKGKVAKTWLDDYEQKGRELAKKEERFNERAARLRQLAVARGRKAAELAFNKAISPKFKALNLDPYDVKAIFNPIDFLVFKGMTKENSITDIVLLSKYVNNPNLNLMRQQVKNIVSQNKYNWLVARINGEGRIAFE